MSSLIKEVKYLVVHCSDSPNSVTDNRFDTAEDIHRWHMQNGWVGIGYHEVICENGDIQHGRPIYWKGAHCKDYNSISLGVCMIGKNHFHFAQWMSLIKVLSDWKKRYPDAEVVGHRDLDPRKPCPNFDVRNWWSYISNPRV